MDRMEPSSEGMRAPVHVEVANAVAAYFEAVDGQQWETVMGAMRRPTLMDYSSFGAGAPAERMPEDVVADWGDFLPGFDHTHHQLGNLQIQVSGNVACVDAYVTGAHVIGSESWTVTGRYEIGLVMEEGRWLMSSLRFLYKFQTGAELVERAQARAKARKQA